MVLEEKPLVVDLDGSLLKTDLLYESANQFFALFPLQFWKIFLWAFRGKAYLKKHLALRIKLNPSLLPYNQGVLKWLFDQKAAGRNLILATASHEILARSVASHLNIFSEVIATQNTINLRGQAKKIALCNKFGSKGFDYLGDSIIDIPVWKEANNSYVVTNSQRLNKTLKKIPTIKIQTIFPNEHANFLVSLIKVLRIHQWVKNLLIFIPIIAAHRLFDHLGLMHAVLAFIAFSLCASAVLYRAPQIIWMACPVMLYWISRTWLITHRGLMHDDPIIFAVKDKVSWAVALCFIFIFILASL